MEITSILLSWTMSRLKQSRSSWRDADELQGPARVSSGPAGGLGDVGGPSNRWRFRARSRSQAMIRGPVPVAVRTWLAYSA